MFYDTSHYRKSLEPVRDDRTHALVNILPRESKRLISKGVLAMPEVKRVLEKGWFVVSRGITPSYILEELTEQEFDTANCTAGSITEGRMASVLNLPRMTYLLRVPMLLIQKVILASLQLIRQGVLSAAYGLH